LSTPVYNLTTIRDAANLRKKQNRALLNQVSRKPPAQLDNIMQELHEDTFAELDCLTCANCCRTTSPIFQSKDIDRLAKRLRVRPVQLIENYLRIDDDGDYVLKSSPCPFLQSDNRCEVYDDRPTACRTYPHTDRKKFHQLIELTYKNTFICPAVQKMMVKLESIVK
jgi:Fe-S-cluster containining protein